MSLYRMKMRFGVYVDPIPANGNDLSLLKCIGAEMKPVQTDAITVTQEVPFIPTKENLNAYETSIASACASSIKNLREVRFLGYDSFEQIQGMDAARAKQIAFCALQLLREEETKNFADWKSRDDWIFSELDIERSELFEIFDPYGDVPHSASCFNDGESPKDYDMKHFAEIH